MLKASARLSREEFMKAFKGARRVRFPGIQVLYSPDSSFKVSAVVSKKIASTAVRRNYMRRSVYAAARDWYTSAPHATGTYIFVLQSDAKSISISTLRDSVMLGIESFLPPTTYSR